MQPYNYTKTNMNNVIEKLFSGSHWHLYMVPTKPAM